MIRLFNVYYPTRTIILLLCEALIVSGSFLLATVMILGPDTYICLNYEYGTLKIAALTVLTLLFGGAAVSLTGVYLAVRRIRRDFAALLRHL